MGKIQIVDLTEKANRNLERACSILSNGGVVALPTETVYGLAGSINHSQALETIFSLKKRPHSDPLIVHIFDVSWISRFAELTVLQSSVVRTLASRFWPGPLTLVLDANEGVHPLVRAGSPTVALRSPSHPFFRSVLEALDAGIAAPSANLFGHISPTSAQDVAEEFHDADLVVFDGGNCAVGIESSVVRVERDGTCRVLRPGIITEQEIQNCLLQSGLSIRLLSKETTHAVVGGSCMSPGTSLKHYAPRLPTFILTKSEYSEESSQVACRSIPIESSVIVDFGSSLLSFVESGEISCLSYLNPSPLGDLKTFTQRLFATLRLAESIHGAKAILVHFTCAGEQSWSKAIHDRIFRAASGKRAMILPAKKFVQVFDGVL